MGTITEPSIETGRQGRVITFYSFKGGVGRSMALANVAAVYAQRGKRVLALDFDFEAPGLHRYFLMTEEAAFPRHEPSRQQLGMLNFFYALRNRLRTDWPDGDGFQGALDRLPAIVGELLDSGDYLYRISIKNPNARDASPARLDFAAAARFDNTYAELVRDFDWQAFYDDYAEVFPALAHELAQRYDYVLIDSRTGVTDIGSICTMMLPEKLVLVFTPNEQSLRGALDTGWQAIQGRKQTPDPRPLTLFPLLSRVDPGEEPLRRTWLSRVRHDFERLFRKVYPEEQIDLETYFNIIQIPYRSYYSYGERIATEERHATDTGSLAPAFHRLADRLDQPSAIQFLSSTGEETSPRDVARAQSASLATSPNDHQILIVIDLFPVVSVDELERKLPAERYVRHTLRLTDFGAPVLSPPGRSQAPIFWPVLAKAVESLADKVLDLCLPESRPVVLFIGGQGPLPVFIHLGYALSKFAPRQVFLNRHYGSGEWEVFRLDVPREAEAPLLDYQRGLLEERQFATGLVAVYVDIAGRPAPVEDMVDLCSSRGEVIAGVVEMRSSAVLNTTPANVTALALELTQAMARVCAIYPHQSGLTVFVAGPTLVAFLLGRALNPSIIKRVYLTNLNVGEYEFAYALPFAEQNRPAISQEPSDQLERRHVFDSFVEALSELQHCLQPEHIPTDVLGKDNRGRFVSRVCELRLGHSVDEETYLSIGGGQFSLSVGLLAALRLKKMTNEQQKDVAKLLFLHEIVQEWQSIPPHNHASRLHASRLVEQLDFAADMFALRVACRIELEQGGLWAAEHVKEILRRWIETAIYGVEAFDLLEHGTRIGRLVEPRLGRYLTWHIQLARAFTVRTASDVDMLLAPPISVELAPVAGRIDPQRHEMEVLHALPGTELFCAVGGQLVRQAKRPGLDPGQLIEAVRTYSHAPIQQIMHFLVDQHREKLASWRS